MPEAKKLQRLETKLRWKRHLVNGYINNCIAMRPALVTVSPTQTVFLFFETLEFSSVCYLMYVIMLAGFFKINQ